LRNPRHNQDVDDSASAVQAYYERNTRLFLSLGVGWKSLAMRRAVWGEGVESLPQAVDYVNSLIAAEVRPGGAGAAEGREVRVLDIGCGVGGSLIYLAGTVGAGLRGTGVTISPRQAEIARLQARQHGLSQKLSFLAADFGAVSGLPPFHLAFAVESFVHISTPDAFFSAAARSLAPGARLIVVDDFLSDRSFARKELRLVETFRNGWLLPSLCAVNHATGVAAAHGMRLVEDRNLTSCLSGIPLGARLGTWLVSVMRAIPVPWAYWRSSIGSLALACCQQQGLVEYHFMVFEKKKA
jgi:SAM-dependent methyltransferase